jgi:hypothetical protein
VIAVGLLVAFYDIAGRKGKVLFYSSLSDTIRDLTMIRYSISRIHESSIIIGYYGWTGKKCMFLKKTVVYLIMYMTAGWSSGLSSRLRNQRFRVQILVVSRGFCDEQHLLTSHGCLYV